MDEKSEYNLKKLMNIAREKKGYSQRQLAKKIGIHHSTLNDIENGRIKKIDIEILRRISEELEISLESLLNASGYNKVAYAINDLTDKPRRNTKKNLENMLDEYRDSQLDLLDDAYQKRDNVRDCRMELENLITMLDKYDFYKEILPMEKVVTELKGISKRLLKSAEKYDYSKLPKDNLNK